MARVTVGWQDGKQLYKTVGYFEYKWQAEQAISLDAVMPVSEKANITLKNLFEEWKQTRAYTELKCGTQTCYNSAFAFMSMYHNTKFRDLRLPQFQRMIDNAEAQNKSHSTMEKIKTLSGILSHYAKDSDIINKTYYESVRFPKTARSRVKPTFSDIEIKSLFKNDKLPFADTILMLIYTGMRINELLSLSKFSIDLDNMLITGGSKTDAGTDRIIPIHPKIQGYVRARYESSRQYLIEDKGKKLSYNTYTLDYYYPILESLGIRRLTPHKARHTFFTMMSEKCTDKKAMALIGGHTDPAFTSKTYDQPDIDRLRKAIESLQ